MRSFLLKIYKLKITWKIFLRLRKILQNWQIS